MNNKLSEIVLINLIDINPNTIKSSYIKFDDEGLEFKITSYDVDKSCFLRANSLNGSYINLWFGQNGLLQEVSIPILKREDVMLNKDLFIDKKNKKLPEFNFGQEPDKRNYNCEVVDFKFIWSKKNILLVFENSKLHESQSFVYDKVIFGIFNNKLSYIGYDIENEDDDFFKQIEIFIYNSLI